MARLMEEPSRHIQPGDRAPDFTLPAAHGIGSVSLREYRARGPVLLALFRGLYCPFCRRNMARLGEASHRLMALGVETVGVIAAPPERSRLYFRYRRTPIPFGADPELRTHRAYGLPNLPVTPELATVLENAAVLRSRELGLETTASDALKVFSALDGFEPTTDDEDAHQRHRTQLAGQFLIDREGVVRWAHVERIENVGALPPEEELLAAARAI